MNNNNPYYAVYELLISSDPDAYSLYLCRPLSEFISLIESIDNDDVYPDIFYENIIRFIMNFNDSLDENGILLHSYTPLLDIYKFYKPNNIPFFTKLNINQMYLLTTILRSNLDGKINVEPFLYKNNRLVKDKDNSYIYDLFNKINNAISNNTLVLDEIKYIISNIQIKKEHIIKTKKGYVPHHRYNYTSSHFSCIDNFKMCFVLLLDNNDFIDADILYHLLIILNDNDIGEIVDKIIQQNNIMVDFECLKSVCRYCDAKRIKFVLDFKIKPDTGLLNILIGRLGASPDYDGEKYIKNNIHPFIDNVFNLFITYGYEPTYNDVIKFAEHSIELPNIHKYDINIDYGIYKKFISFNGKYIPKRYKYNMTLEEQFYIIYSCDSTIQAYKNFFKKNKDFILTEDHMADICKKCSNRAVLDFLVKRGSFVNYKCLLNMTHLCRTNSNLLDFALKSYQNKFKIDVKK